MNPSLLRFVMNLWSPYRGAGIRVRHIAPDYREALVELRLGLLNRNYFGQHFGGSLYTMTDPFFALMLIHILGPEYLVHHKDGSIEYVAPGTGAVSARFAITDEQIANIKAKTADGEKYFPQFSTEVVNAAGETIARVTHTLYVRRKAA